MRKQSGFALIQVMLFSALVATMLYAMMLVQSEHMRESVASQKAQEIEPAVYDLVNYAMAQESSNYADGDSADYTKTGSNYYDENDPLSSDYASELSAAGYDTSGVEVTVSHG